MPSGSGIGRREGGYNLVILIVVITLMNLAVAITLPLWSQIIQREKEEELIFRGLQYAEAIRVFRTRFQRPPVRLEELVEAKPRSIRRLYPDPMTDDGKWQLLFEGVQQAPGTLSPQVPGNGEDDQGIDKEGRLVGGRRDEGEKGGNDSGEDLDPSDLGDFELGKKQDVQIGPIEGVRSRSHKESILVWFNQKRYDLWEFRWQLLAGQKSFGIPGENGQAIGGGAPRESILWLGRPWRFGIQGQAPGIQPTPGQPNGGQPPNPNQPPGGPPFGVPRGLPPDPGAPPAEVK